MIQKYLDTNDTHYWENESMPGRLIQSALVVIKH